MPFSSLRAVALTALLCATACGGDATPSEPRPDPVPPGIRAVAGAAVDDTILSQPLQALVVEVRGANGALAHGVTVRFEAAPPADTARRFERAIYVCALSAPACGPAATPFGAGSDSQFASDTTDAQGRAKALVRLGTVAGPARLTISAPEIGLRDSVTFTVRPGSPAVVRFATRDTMLYVGGSVSLRPAVRDRYNNARTDAVTLTADTSRTVDVDDQGAATARQIGRARVIAQAGIGRDTAFVSVIPRGRIVAWAAYDNGGSIVLVDMNGSGLRRVTTNPSSYGAFPSFAPRSGRVLFHTGSPTVDVVDTTSGARATIGTQPSYFAQFLPDESGVLFVGLHDGFASAMRANADGTQPQTLAALGNFYPYPYGGAAFSPTGDRIAYVNGSALTVLEFRTARSFSSQAAIAPRWSPSGDRIAFTTGFDGQVGVMNADGTGRRILTTEAYSPGIGWSPDGEWLIARRAYPSGLTLVRVSDGLTMPLRFTLDLYQPSWR